MTSSERIHKSRHTAGQRVLDATGNLKAVQKLLGHASIQTTGDIYADWDIDQLAATMADVLAADEDDETADSQSFPLSPPQNRRFAAETRNQWRRRESNPRPRSRENGFYERIRRSVLVPGSPRRRGCWGPASLVVPRLAEALRAG
jgi:Phage integrase family